MPISVKTLCLITIFIMNLTGLALAQKKVDREMANLVGPVKSVSEQNIPYKGAQPDPGDTVTYDAEGNEVERVMFSDFGELMGTEVRTLGPDGYLRESTTSSQGSPQRIDKYVHQAGKLAHILVYDDQRVLRQKISKVYDSIGNLIEEIYYDPIVARARTVSRFDENGNLVEAAFFLGDKQKAVAPIGPCLGAHRVTYQYDSKKRVVLRTAFDPDGSEKKTWTYNYDERGNYVLYTIKSGTSVTKITYSYDYDDNKNWIRRTSVSETDDNFLEQMLDATGKKLTPEELRAMKERSRITSVTIRKITYFPAAN